MNRSERKVVIVTGAGSGIGAATAKRFLQEGAAVVLNGRRKNKLEETAHGFRSDRVLIDSGDISERDYVFGLVKRTVDRFKRIDVLVNNAAISALGPFGTTPEEEWHRVMRTLCANISETSRPSTITVGRGKKSHFDEHKQDKQYFGCVGSFGA